jgi:hypothetical protein
VLGVHDGRLEAVSRRDLASAAHDQRQTEMAAAVDAMHAVNGRAGRDDAGRRTGGIGVAVTGATATPQLRVDRSCQNENRILTVQCPSLTVAPIRVPF